MNKATIKLLFLYYSKELSLNLILLKGKVQYNKETPGIYVGGLYFKRRLIRLNYIQ